MSVKISGVVRLSYTMETTVSDVLRQLYGNKKPDLSVKQCLNRLTPFPSVVLDTGHVLLYTIDSLVSIGWAEEARTGRLIRKEEVDSTGPYHGECSEE